MIRSVLSAKKYYRNHQLIIRPHPSTDGQLERMLVQDYGGHAQVISDGDSGYWISNAALVITEASTTGVEALYLDRPVMVLNFSGREPLIPIASSGAALEIDNPELVGPVIERLLSESQEVADLSEARSKIVRDGKATERTVQLIRDLLAL